jgi:hypothetical protein
MPFLATYDELNTPNGKLMTQAKTAGSVSNINITTGNDAHGGSGKLFMPNGGYLSIQQIPEKFSYTSSLGVIVDGTEGTYPDSQAKLEVTTEILGEAINRCSIQPSNDGRSILIQVNDGFTPANGVDCIQIQWVNGLAANTARVRGVGIKNFIYT